MADAGGLFFLAMTFVRTSELIGAKWEELDLESARWNIPAERMKMSTPHIVPLSRQALDVLALLKQLSGENELVFPGGAIKLDDCRDGLLAAGFEHVEIVDGGPCPSGPLLDLSVVCTV